MTDSARRRIVRVTAEHLALLRRMQVIWVPIEAEAPYVSHQCPYGGRDIAGDVRRILAAAISEDYAALKTDDATHLHDEALRRLAIFISAGRLSPGPYSYELGLAADERALAPWALKHLRPGSSSEIDISITGAHLKLLKRLRIEVDDSELPVNVKRPYGDMTAFELDMSAILAVTPAAGDELSREQRESLFELHQSLEAVLQVWLPHATLVPGDYAEDDEGNWHQVESPADRIVLIALTRKPPTDHLIDAITQKDLAAARHLLEHSADPLAEDSSGFTAMAYAMRNGDLDAVKLLLQGGVGPNTPQGQAQVTPLIQSAAAGSVEIFSYLLQHGGDLSCRTLYQTTPLGAAVVYSRADIVKAILDTGWSEPGSLGVVRHSDSQLAEAYARTGVTAGAVVANVKTNSTADRMNLQVDDVIVEVGGKPIQRFEDLIPALNGLLYGDDVHIVFLRQGRRHEAHATLGPRIGEPFFKFNAPPAA